MPRLNHKAKEKITKDFLKSQIQKRKDSGSSFFTSGGSGTRVYKGARTTKHNENWKVYKDTADYELSGQELPVLRSRCRQMDKDNPIAEGTVIAFQEMVVGSGPFVHSKLSDSPDAEKQVQDVLDDWILNVDNTGELTLNDFCRNLVSNVCDNGDALITLSLSNSDRRKIQTCIQLIEADRIMTPSGMTNEPVRHGVQYNRQTGEIDGYWVRKLGITENEHRYGFITGGSRIDFEFFPRYKNGRLSAWLFKRPSAIMRPGQSRQTPLFSSCIHTLKQMEDLVDATVVGQRVAACIMGSIKSNDIEGLVDSLTRDPLSYDRNSDSSGNKYSKMQPGMMIPLKAGESLELFNPQRNGVEVVETMKALARDVAMKTRIPYGILFLDLSATNFSSARTGILEARRMLAGWRMAIQYKVLKPILETVLLEASLRGLIPALDVNKPLVGWPAWGFIDPAQEITATVNAINNKLTSPQRAISEQGADWREVYEEIALAKVYANQLAEKYGVNMENISLSGNGQTLNNQESQKLNGDNNGSSKSI